MSDAVRLSWSSNRCLEGSRSRRARCSVIPRRRLPFSKIETASSCVRISIATTKIIGEIQGLNNARPSASSVDDRFQDLDSPVSIELKPIVNEGQFDRTIAEAQQLEESVVVLWMASWCRKCIYLKPKLEKLAAEYHPRIQFYCIDVNSVPHRLVTRAGVTKMPTIQIWKDGKKQDEVIGGHKAHLVVDEVREMIENECNL